MKESEIIKKLYKDLVTQSFHKFPQQRKPLVAPKKKGVYVIANQKKVALHVGQTPRGKCGIHQRLRNHLNGRSSFVRSYFNGDGTNLRRGGNCYKYLAVENDRKRSLLEAYATGCLCPKHIG